MPRQAKSFVIISLTCAMLLTILIQSACNKEKEKDDLNFISREDFIDALDGQWHVNGFSRMIMRDNSESICITLLGDSVKWISSTDDTTICY
jgi:hypothetical protein